MPRGRLECLGLGSAGGWLRHAAGVQHHRGGLVLEPGAGVGADDLVQVGGDVGQ